MRLSKLLNSFVKFSLIIGLGFLTGCRDSGPSVTICILDPERNALQCGLADGETYELPVELARDYACLSLSDLEVLLNYVKQRCKKP